MMTKCISVGGYPVEVMTPGQQVDVQEATIETAGIMKQAAPVADVPTIAVTDIQSAQDAIAAMGTTLAEVMQAMRQAGQMAVED